MSEKLGNIINLGSSSKGNAFYVELKRSGYEKPFGILLDCGFKYDKIATRLRNYGKSVNDIDAILVTHEHNDHCIGVKGMSDNGKKIYAPFTVFNKLDIKTDKNNVVKAFHKKGIASGITVLPIPLDHMELDGNYIENYAYIVEVDKDFRLMYVTDTKFVRYNLAKYPCDIIIVESNFDIVMMNYAIDGSVGYEKTHFKRVLNSHMSVQHTAKWLSNLDLRKTKLIVLMHLTTNSKNANPSRFKSIVQKKLKLSGKKYIPKILVAKENGGFQ